MCGGHVCRQTHRHTTKSRHSTFGYLCICTCIADTGMYAHTYVLLLLRTMQLCIIHCEDATMHLPSDKCLIEPLLLV